MKQFSKRTAFSLVELSIVLVILGLLVGGILAGQSLIRASELRAVTTEYHRYIAATYAFKDRYFALPGDFGDATRFWGRMSGNADCITLSAATINSDGVCDGDGNGTLAPPAAANQSGEVFQYWRHLQKAGLLEGTYTGMSESGGSMDSVLRVNIPASKVSTAGWNPFYYGTVNGNGSRYSILYGNYFDFGAVSSVGPINKVLLPEEAWNIDSKMDDGKPAYGKVIARHWNNQCARPDDGVTFTNTNFASSYNLLDKTLQCALMFRQIF